MIQVLIVSCGTRWSLSRLWEAGTTSQAIIDLNKHTVIIRINAAIFLDIAAFIWSIYL